MALLSSFNEDRPVSYIRGYPIYCATLLTIAYGVGILLTAVLHQTIDLFGLFAFLPSRSILQGQVWQIFTYSFVNLPSFFILFSLFFLYIAAVEVEKYIGRARFLALYAILILTPVVVDSVWVLLFREVYPIAGDYLVSVGFFIAFCTLYPGLQWLGFLSLRWLGVISYAIGAIMSISQADWFGLFSLTLVCLGAFGYIRFLQAGLELPSIPNPFRALRRPRFRVVSKPTPRSAPATDFRQNDNNNEIDRLLDKIAKYGLASLSAKEREALERARARLLEKDRN
jgi:membrane associated rhomboid family serine protease